MSHVCEAIEQPDQPLLAIRNRAAVQDLPQVMGRSFGAVGQYLGELGEAPAGPPVVAYYNMDMQDLDLEIGFPTARSLPAKGEIQSSKIPAGKFAVCLYTGPYEEMASAYEALNGFMKEKGYEATGVVLNST